MAEVEPPRGELKNFFLGTRRRKNKGLFSPALERDGEDEEERFHSLRCAVLGGYMVGKDCILSISRSVMSRGVVL